MRRVTRALLLGAGAWALAAAPRALPAQSREDPSIEVVVTPETAARGPLVRATGALDRRDVESLVANGFPARLSWRVELWSAGSLVNDFEGAAAWDLLLRFDPVSRDWIVSRLERDRSLVVGRFAAFADAAALALDAGRVPLPATKPRRHYYLARLTVEVLSLSDLREAERWLRGDLQPAVRGEKSAGTAIGGFFRAIATRMLGARKQTLEGRSATFVPDAG